MTGASGPRWANTGIAAAMVAACAVILASAATGLAAQTPQEHQHAVDDASFSVSLIPETLERTTLGGAAYGHRVNIEVDVLAKYVEKLVTR